MQHLTGQPRRTTRARSCGTSNPNPARTRGTTVTHDRGVSGSDTDGLRARPYGTSSPLMLPRPRLEPRSRRRLPMQLPAPRRRQPRPPSATPFPCSRSVTPRGAQSAHKSCRGVCIPNHTGPRLELACTLDDHDVLRPARASEMGGEVSRDDFDACPSQL